MADMRDDTRRIMGDGRGVPVTPPSVITQPRDDFRLSRLCEAIRSSRKTLQFFRNERRDAVREYVGAHYSDEGSRHIQPVNFLWLYVSIVTRALVPKTPRFLFSVDAQAEKPFVKATQEWVNRRTEETGLADVFARWSYDGLFSLGILKVALTMPAESAAGGWGRKAGLPYAANVDLDDFVFDAHCRDFAHASYVGHRYRVPLDAVRGSPVYLPAARDLKGNEDTSYNEDGDERVQMIGRGYQSNSDEEYEEYVDLWDVYLPRHRRVVTLASDSGGSATTVLVRDVPWVGPPEGPYHFLGFGTVPGNPMPVSPVMQLRDLASLGNRLFRKLGRQADRQKNVLPVPNLSSEDAERLKNSADGEMFKCDRPDGLRPIDYGGPNAANIAFFTLVKELFSFIGGNLQVLGGRSTEAKTLGQENILQSNASAGIADLQLAMTKGISRVGKAYGWYCWKDPFATYKSTYTAPGLPDLSTEQTATPADRRRTPWSKLDIRVDPYSLQFQSPAQRLAQLNAVIQQTVMPALPLMQQQGVVIDWNRLMSVTADLTDLSELREVITMQEPVAVEPPAGGSSGGMPGAGGGTERTYTRVNVPGRTEQGDSMNMRNAMMGLDTGGDPNKDRNGVAKAVFGG